MTKELLLHKTGILKLVSAKKLIFNEKPSKSAWDIPTSWGICTLQKCIAKSLGLCISKEVYGAKDSH